MILAFLSLAALLYAAGESDPSVLEARGKTRACAAVAAVAVQVPAESIELGASAKSYHCWKLALTSERGRRIRAVFERLKSLQGAIADSCAGLEYDLAAYETDKEDRAALTRALRARDAALKNMLSAYDELIAAAERAGLLRRAEKSLFRQQPALLPKMEDPDYTMTYDASKEGCAAPAK